MFRRTIISIVGSIVVLAAVCIGGSGTAHADGSTAVEQANKAAAAWLKLVDDGKYQDSWSQASSFFKDRVSAGKWTEMVTLARKPLGAGVSREFSLAHYSTSLPVAPDGE